MTLKTYYELATMDAKDVFAYERSLGFIAPIFDAVTHADNIRGTTSAACQPAWSATWTFDNARERDHFAMIARKRGYVVNELPRSEFGLRLETRLVAAA